MTDNKSDTKATQGPASVQAKKNKSKNIIICSDGTGNRGGVGPSTNVWRLYNGIDLNHQQRKQITYYDDGVGTEDSKYLKMLTGAMGLGFTRNVKQIYKFLVLNYVEGDDIYLFGFSRGAYTVRALSAFVTSCGVIKDAKRLDDQQLTDAVDQLLETYHQRPRLPKETSKPSNDVLKKYMQEVRTHIETNFKHPNYTNHQDKLIGTKINTIGVWDTVSAIGLPFEVPFKDWLLKKRFQFKFRDYALSPDVAHAYHALAIDDERLSFHPEVWDESVARKGQIEQVWFSGMHSDVGGGYPKQGLAHVTLEWMIARVKPNGLFFQDGFEDEVKREADVHAKLYDSRSGFAAFYRYAPRNIEALYKKASGSGATHINVHESVFDRIGRRTGNYNPGNLLPGSKLDIHVTPGGIKPSQAQTLQNKINQLKTKRGSQGDPAAPWVEKRKNLHWAFVVTVLMVITAFVVFMIFRLDLEKHSLQDAGEVRNFINWIVLLLASVTMLYASFKLRSKKKMFSLLVMWGVVYGFKFIPKAISEILLFILPDIVAEAIIYFAGNHPQYLALVLSLFILGWVLRERYREECSQIYENAWETLHFMNDTRG